jgi:broad specificity phosphatase PhoE
MNRMNHNHAPNNPTTLYIVRHGESLTNAGIPFPRTPEGSPLTALGREQAHIVAKELAHVHADAVIASNLTRARQTAEIIAAGRGIDVRIIPELHERSIGSFGDRTGLHDLDEYRPLFEAYERGTQQEKMAWKLADEWESLDEALHRFLGAVEQVAEEYRSKTAIVVAHGTVMRTFLIHQNFGTLDQLPDNAIDNTGYIVVKTDGHTWTITNTHGVHLKETATSST